MQGLAALWRNAMCQAPLKASCAFLRHVHLGGKPSGFSTQAAMKHQTHNILFAPFGLRNYMTISVLASFLQSFQGTREGQLPSAGGRFSWASRTHAGTGCIVEALLLRLWAEALKLDLSSLLVISMNSQRCT